MTPPCGVRTPGRMSWLLCEYIFFHSQVRRRAGQWHMCLPQYQQSSWTFHLVLIIPCNRSMTTTKKINLGQCFDILTYLYTIYSGQFRQNYLSYYLAAACKPDALCTLTTSVTIREAAPLPVSPSGLTGLCLYLMHTSSRPGKQSRSVRTWNDLNVPIPSHDILCVPVFTWGLRLMSCQTVCPGKQWQGKHLGLIRILILHGDHSTQLGQWKQSFGYKLISDIWVIIPGDTQSSFK